MNPLVRLAQHGSINDKTNNDEPFLLRCLLFPGRLIGCHDHPEIGYQYPLIALGCIICLPFILISALSMWILNWIIPFIKIDNTFVVSDSNATNTYESCWMKALLFPGRCCCIEYQPEYWYHYLIMVIIELISLPCFIVCYFGIISMDYTTPRFPPRKKI